MILPKYIKRLAAAAVCLALLAACADTPSSSEAPPAPPVASEVRESAATSFPPEPEAQPIEQHALQLLPVQGATGYASIAMDMLDGPTDESAVVGALAPGSGFAIVQEVGEWWLVDTGEGSGWVKHQYCLVNLPDLIPSIVYNNTNTYASVFVSSGHAIPGITGMALYEGRTNNPRLGREEYIMPVLYQMAGKIFAAQKAALAEGNTLVIYEAFRPFSVQMGVVDALTALSVENEEVLAGIDSHPWSMNWFIATGVSNHQMGYAIDVTLARVDDVAYHKLGEYTYPQVTAHTEYEMPTAIHELSAAAATFSWPVNSTVPDAWESAALAETMNDAAVLLQTYCTGAGLTPLASEWWHFNDLDAREATLEHAGDGNYILTQVYSAAL